jgi:signal transduction histidine kinase
MLLTVFTYLIKWKKKSAYSKGDKIVFTVNLSAMHLQVLGGIALYFLSPKVQFSGATMSASIIRFFTVEHAFMMILAVVLVTIASSKIKLKPTDEAKFKTGFWFSFIALVIVLLAIPWPFQSYGAGWV